MAINKQLGGIFQQMVLEEAAKDKLNEYEQQTKESQILDVDSHCQNDNDEPHSLRQLRESRLAQMKEQHKIFQENKIKGHGEYQEVIESEFLSAVTGSELVVCHFYHREFERCKIMDMHLRRLAMKYHGTRFIKINAEKAPFFVTKLKIKSLPTVVFFKDGVAFYQMLGFNDVGGHDEFKTETLAKVLKSHEIISKSIKNTNSDSEDST
eukprot:Platyproteum_vivax@DN4376_c0_g1_i1.p1